MFYPDTVTLDAINHQVQVEIWTNQVAVNGANTVQVQIQHDPAVTQITSPQCAGIYAGGLATAPSSQGGNSTAFLCSLHNGPSGAEGAVLRFTVTRTGSGDDTLSFLVDGGFGTAFFDAGEPLNLGDLGTLTVSGD